jgi:hypothetical protein
MVITLDPKNKILGYNSGVHYIGRGGELQCPDRRLKGFSAAVVMSSIRKRSFL